MIVFLCDIQNGHQFFIMRFYFIQVFCPLPEINIFTYFDIKSKRIKLWVSGWRHLLVLFISFILVANFYITSCKQKEKYEKKVLDFYFFQDKTCHRESLCSSSIGISKQIMDTNILNIECFCIVFMEYKIYITIIGKTSCLESLSTQKCSFVVFRNLNLRKNVENDKWKDDTRQKTKDRKQNTRNVHELSNEGGCV